MITTTIRARVLATRESILATCERLDPHHQGQGWPDPVEWDGRSLEEQASDLQALVDARQVDTERAESADRA